MVRVLALIACAAAAVLAGADGKIFSVVEDVSIRRQQARIEFDGKTQVTIVANETDAKAGPQGWILPVPARPTRVEAKATLSFMNVMGSVRPRTQDPALWVAAFALLATIGLSVWTMKLRYGSGNRWVGLSYPFELLAVAGISFSVLMFAALKLVKSESALAAESYGQVGSYQATLLSSGTEAETVAWLGKEGFQVSEQARKAIGAYGRDGWKFLAGRFAPKEPGQGPHPVLVEWQWDRAVYPMRLTGAQSGSLLLELAVAGKGMATANGLATWSCRPSHWTTMSTPIADGGWISYLRGELEAEDMAEDIVFKWEEGAEFSAIVYPEEDAPLVLVGAAALGVSLWWAIWGAVCAASARLRAKMALPLLFGGLAAAGLASGTAFWATETVPTKVESIFDEPVASGAGVGP